MKKRYILIDSENVQNRLFEIIETSKKTDRIMIFYTVHRSGKLDEYLRLHSGRKNIQFIECMTGNNALDLQLIGVLSFLIQRHRNRSFVVYSNDKGFQKAVSHWQKMYIDVQLISTDELKKSEEDFSFDDKKKRKKKKKKQKKTAAVPVVKRITDDGGVITEITDDGNEEKPLTVLEAVAPPGEVSSKRDLVRIPAEKTEGEENASESAHKMSNAEFIREICRSIKSTDLSLLCRVLNVGFGTENAKEIYSHFKSDEAYRSEMGKLYYPTKPLRRKSLVETALKYNELDAGIADDVCRLILENGTSNMQKLYRSFIKSIPGELSYRQKVYKVIKPYLPVISSI